MSETVYVYIIAAKEGETLQSPVKVGVSRSPQSRLENLQTACPFELAFAATFAFPSRSIALNFEDCFHSLQKEHKLRGEWFDMPPHKAVSVARLYARWCLELLTSLNEEEREAAIEFIEGDLPKLVLR